MISILAGLLTALCWGSADALARWTGQTLGAKGSLFAMMCAGSAGLALWMAISGHPWPSAPSAWTVAAALSSAIAMLAFYEALRRGPVALVSPAAAAYPAWAVTISIGLLGVRADGVTLAAVAVTLAGVIGVGWRTDGPDGHQAGRTLTLGLALLSSLLFAVTLLVGQRAIAYDGEVLVVWWGRNAAIAVSAMLLLTGARPRRPSARLAKPLAGAMLQGTLDAAGLVCVLSVGAGIEGTLASVVSSAFGAVTVILARIFYGERVSPRQTAAMVAVFGGVAALAALH